MQQRWQIRVIEMDPKDSEDALVAGSDQLPAVSPSQLPAVSHLPNIVTVFAKDPAQMQVAQDQMIAWAKLRVSQREAELADLKENLEVAVKNKWRTATLKRAVARTRKRVEYYVNVGCSGGRVLHRAELPREHVRHPNLSEETDTQPPEQTPIF